MHAAAEAIAQSQTGRAADFVVIYSNRANRRETGTGRWVQVSQDDFFGRKFGRLLQEVPMGHPLLLIQVDAVCGDWSSLVQRCDDVMSKRPDIGLWTPRIDNTPFQIDTVATRFDGDGLWEVAQTDGIVLGLSGPVVDRLRELDYSENNLGWGIDWAAVGFCRLKGLKAVGDTSVQVHHPIGTGYNADLAYFEMDAFLRQLSDAEIRELNDAKALVDNQFRQRDNVAEQTQQRSRKIIDMGPITRDVDASVLDSVSFLVVSTGRVIAVPRDSRHPISIRGAHVRQPNADNKSVMLPRVLDFDMENDRTLHKHLATGEKWAFPGQSTQKTVFFANQGPRRTALTISAALTQGAFNLYLGVSAHRATVEIHVEIEDVDGIESPIVHRIPVDPRFSGLAETADFQSVDVRIPDNGSPRKLSVYLSYLEGDETLDAPPLVLASRPFLIAAENRLDLSSFIVLIADDYVSDALPEVVDIAPSHEGLVMAIGEKSFQLLAGPDDEATLQVSGRNLLASAQTRRNFTLFVRNSLVRLLTIGPDPLTLDISVDVLAEPGANIELRDPTGNVVYARLETPAGTLESATAPRHPDAWGIDALFDVDFYLSGFPEGTSLADPASHFLTEGWLNGRDPAPWFSVWHYLAMHPDVAAANMNPFLHYCIAGKNEGRKLPRLGGEADNDITSVYSAHAYAVAPGPHFEEFDPTIGAGRTKRAKVIAYYLPQFHPIQVNDTQWGKGFTEWRNLPRGMPRFKGHIQPRIPRDLGNYGLHEGDVMRRQIEMARVAGLFGFCFYHYWFDGKRVMETPMERFLADPTLDFPFCLMWANENWTRTWDGSEKEVILGQTYREEDDLPFIDDVARHMKDPRYICINGRPLFLIYRPGHIPEAKSRLAEWREIFRQRHGLDPLLFNAQAFGDNDPRALELDGAIEFPPHKVLNFSPDRKNEVKLIDPKFSGSVPYYTDVVAAAKRDAETEYPLIHTVFPCWDNDARRPGRGTIVAHSTPEAFGGWLDWAIEQAEKFPIYGESVVCINAWNEWAEGAYLEPDVHYGAAYLNTVARVVHTKKALTLATQAKLLLVGHDAMRFGAQQLLLNIGKVLTTQFGCEVRFLLISESWKEGVPGELIDEYRKLGDVRCVHPASDLLPALLDSDRTDGFALALTNTTSAGAFVEPLKAAGFAVISLVHELPGLLRSYELYSQASAIARLSDRVIFPAEKVKVGFEELVGKVANTAEIFPQGLYNTSLLNSTHGSHALHAELGLRPNAKIILGAGFADLRKGIDRFVAAGLSICGGNKDVVFLWLGALSLEAAHWFIPEIEAAGLSDRVRILGHRDDIARFFAAADAFYLSSREDPFPSVVLEALACGLPVVGHEGCGGCDALIQKHGVLVAQDNPLAAVDAILGVLKKRDDGAARARRAEIIENYDFPAYVFGLVQRLAPDIASVSAVIPNYNYERYIGDRLRSVFDQTYPLREVIVLDDASPDGSVAEIARVAETAGRKIDLHVNAVNSGSPFPQWRKGVELAKGDYVWIAEADDLAEPSFVARLVTQMQRAGSVLGFVDSRQIDENSATSGASYRPYINQIEAGAFDRPFDMDGREFLGRYLAVKNVILNVSGVIFHRNTLLDSFESVGEQLYTYSVAGDWRLYAEICARVGSRVSYLSDPLNTHRRHKISVTHALKVDKHLGEIESMHRLVGKIVGLTESVQQAQARHFQECKKHLLR